MKISASFLSIKDNLHNNILKLDQTNIDYLHIDIMDGKFVRDITWEVEEMQDLLEGTSKPKDIHLMVHNVIKYIEDFKELNPSFITFHLESSINPLEIINYLQKHNIKIGMSIKPNTSIDALKPYLSYLDLVLIMSVEPGKGGQHFIENSVQKIEELYNLRKDNNYNYMIEVDGGINKDNIKLCSKSDIVVVGSYITNGDNYQKQVDLLNNELDRT